MKRFLIPYFVYGILIVVTIAILKMIDNRAV